MPEPPGYSQAQNEIIFPFFFLFSIISFFFFVLFIFLWSLFLAPFFSNYRSPSRLSFYHSACAGFMESVIVNREYLAKLVPWKKLELKARHNRNGGTCYTHIHCINSAKGICSRKSSEKSTLSWTKCDADSWSSENFPCFQVKLKHHRSTGGVKNTATVWRRACKAVVMWFAPDFSG